MEEHGTQAVLERLDELVALMRRIDTRLQHLTQGLERREPFPDDPDLERPRRLTLADPARTELVGRAGAT